MTRSLRLLAAVRSGVLSSLFVLGGSAGAQEEILFSYEVGLTAGFGTAIDVAGDVDGDGFIDLVVGHVPAAHGNAHPLDKGGFHIVSGKFGTDLLAIEAKSADEWMGGAVAGLGDVTGDGVPDVLIGAPRTPANGLASGAVRIHSAASGVTSLFLVGSQPNDRFGSAVDAAGDVDNDGILDFVVGAPGTSTGPIFGGAIHVRSGQTGAPLLTVLGTVAFAELGAAVAGVGDLNGDGVDDVAAGAPNDDTGADNAGSVHVFSGQDGSTLWVRHQAEFGHGLGFSLAPSGDVDGDGRPDVVAGLPGAAVGGVPFSGGAHLLSGATGAVVRTFAAPVKNAAQGAAVASVGDLDSDGVPDVAVGSPTETSTDALAGAVRVWSGATGALLFAATGRTGGERMGFAVAGVGDVDADGRLDVAVGSPRHLGSTLPTGALTVFSDCKGSFAKVGASCPGTNGLTPFLNVQGCATSGGLVDLRLTVARANATALLLVGPGAAAVALGGSCVLHVASPVLAGAPFSTDSAGRASLAVPIPAGVPVGPLALQAFVQDAAAAPGFTATNGVVITFE